jgi:DNA (cytosine-5)-methyltransferase 1
MPPLRHLDLFSGIGGFALAARMIGGFETVAFCEIDRYAQKVLKKNFPGIPISSDILTLDSQDYAPVDLITGGYPCQPFSSAGKRNGENDHRHLWPEMLRCIERARPTWIVSENVIGHVTLGLDQVLSDLDTLGYTTQPLVIPACAVGAPHRRDRVWIIANAAGEHGAQHGEERSYEKQPSASSDRAALRTHVRDYCWWAPEPRVRRVDDGVSCRVDRNHGLGNAIVPQVAAEILRAIRVIHDSVASANNS